jgi:glucosamine--fructose-6-phosphate aminotransferase (isomerizing)
MSLYTEIFEQPSILQNLLSRQQAKINHIASELRQREIDYVFLVARGTSDNAGRYANYLWGAYNSLPVALATPSLFTYYNRPPKLKNALVVGVSQSGKSPDIVQVMAEGKKQGNPTLGIVNVAKSPLAEASDYVIDIMAGPEKAVAATKSYTTELMALAMLSVALTNDEARAAELNQVPILAQQVLALDEQIKTMAQRYRFMERCVVIGRGFNYATAFEWSLKMKELTYVTAEPYSSADFQHGPIAMVEQGFPVMVVAPSGAVFESLMPMLTALRKVHKAELTIISDNPEALALAQSPIELPTGMPEWVTPIVSIIAAQLFCYHLTVAKGFDTESPRSIHKVTETH